MADNKIAVDSYFAGGGSVADLYSKAVPLAEFLEKFGLNRQTIAPSSTKAAVLESLSQKYRYVRDVHAVLRLSNCALSRADQFILDEGNKRILQLGVDGRTRNLCGPTEWLKDPNRPDVERLVYEPAHPTGCLTDNNFNLCRSNVEPRPGNGLHLFHRLMSELIPDPERREWVGSWLFYPIRYPGTKLYVALLLWSREEGTGKSFLGELVKRMYGVNEYELNNAERLFEPFNHWAERRQFVLVNEIYSGDSRKRINKLKNLVSNEEVEINIKNRPQYSVRDTINYMMTSNHEDALYMTDASRRFAVTHVSENRIDKGFAKELRAWKLSTAGSELLHYGLTYPILDSFEPFAPAPWTEDNAEMARESTSSLEDKCLQVVGTDKESDPRRGWVFAHYDLWTSEEIVRVFNALNDGAGERVNRISVGRAMNKAGAAKLGMIKIHGKPERILAIRDCERYQQIVRESPAKIAALYLAERPTKLDAAEGVDHTRYLLRLTELEMIDREQRTIERRIKEARFPAVKSLDSFDFATIPSLNKTLVLELARFEYVARRENIIAVGNSGTGKTHVALGLGLAACQKGLAVGFTTAAALVNELHEARDEKRLLRLQRQLSGYKLLIVDELGYVPLSPTGAELLFETFSQRYERGSIIVTSNLPFDEWTSVFASERLTGALLDRLTHHVHILEMNGDSYRLKHSKRRITEDQPQQEPS